LLNKKRVKVIVLVLTILISLISFSSITNAFDFASIFGKNTEEIKTIIKEKEVKNIDDSAMLDKFTYLKGYKKIYFDVSSSQDFNIYEAEKNSLSSSDKVVNTFDLNNLQVETEYKEIDTSVFNVDERPVKQKYIVKNLLNEPRDITLHIKYEIDSSKVLWNATEYPITKTPRYFNTEEKNIKSNQSIEKRYILSFDNGYYDFKDVQNLNYQVSVYSKNKRNYIDLEIREHLDALETFVIDPELGWVLRNISSSALGAQSVFAIDLDKDGDIDVLSASDGDNIVAWYENEGNNPPSWTRRVIFNESGNSPQSVYAADFDNDNDIDVVAALANYDEIAWFENNGATPPGGWTRRNVATYVDLPIVVYAIDVDQDGDTDVVSGFALGGVLWHDNNGSSPPGFIRRGVGSTSYTQDVHAADLDNDNDIDILSAAWQDDTIAWYENNGSIPPFWNKRTIGIVDGGWSVYAARINNDNYMDVVAASQDDDRIIWYQNNGASPPNWTERNITYSADSAFSVFAIDLDNDGDTDVISTSTADNKIAWYENLGGSVPSWIARNITTAALYPVEVFAIDVDNDNDIDVLSASSYDNRIAWYENNGSVATVLSILPIQVVENVDLVKGKRTLVRSEIEGTPFARATVKLFFEDVLQETQIKTFNSTGGREIVDFFFSPNSDGNNKKIRVEARVGSYSNNITKFVNITETRDINLFFVPVNQFNSYSDAIRRNIQFMNDTYPIADNGLHLRIDNNPISAPTNPSEEDLRNIRLNILSRIFFSKQKFKSAVGIVDQGYLSGNTGLNFNIGNPDVILIDKTQIKTVAHEVGHTLELCDEYNPVKWAEQDKELPNGCLNGDLDNNSILDPLCSSNNGCPVSTLSILYEDYGLVNQTTILRNFMGGTENQNYSTIPPSSFESWISNDSFNALLEELDVNSDFGDPFIHAITKYLVIRIAYERDSSFTILDSYSLEDGFVNDPNLSDGNFSIELRDNNDNIISNISFEPNFIITAENGTSIITNKTFLIFALSINDNLSSLIFKSNTTVLERINKTPNIPTINLTSPFNKTFSNEVINITWNSSDIDGNSLNHTILFSKDNGDNFSTLGFDISQNNFEVNSSILSDCELCKIKVLVTDSMNTNSSLSPTFSIDNDIQIKNFNVIHSNESEKVFRFEINNSFFNQSVTNVNWTLNTGESIVRSNSSINLAPLENIFVYIYYKYTTFGQFNITANVFNENYSEVKSVNINV